MTNAYCLTNAYYRFVGHDSWIRSRGESKVRNLDETNKNNLLEEAINNGASRVWGINYGGDSDTEFQYDVRIISVSYRYMDKSRYKTLRSVRANRQQSQTHITAWRETYNREDRPIKQSEVNKMYASEEKPKRVYHKEKDKGVGVQRKKNYSVAYQRKIKKQNKT